MHEYWQYGFHCISVGQGSAEKPAGIGGSSQREVNRRRDIGSIIVVPPMKADSNDRSVVRPGCVAENRRLCAGRQQRGAIISPCFSSCQKHDQLKGTKAQLKDFT